MSEGWIIGVDEAGRGPVIGPLVVAALAVPAADLDELRSLGVRDSKDLPATERERIRGQIDERIQNGVWHSGLVICHPKRIDLND